MIAVCLLAALVAAPLETSMNEASAEAWVLVGRPNDKTATAAAPVDITPGAVLFSGEAKPEDKKRHRKLHQALEESYRLEFQSQHVKLLHLKVNQTEVMETMASGPTVEITLVGLGPVPQGTRRDPVATYRVRIKEGEKVLAEQPAVAVATKGRAVVGTRNGERAPYVFVVLESKEPLPPGARGRNRPARLIQEVQPAYPPEALEAVRQSAKGDFLSITVTLDLDAEGHPRNVKLVEGLKGDMGSKLNDAALSAVQQSRYEPARDPQGNAVESTRMIKRFGIRVRPKPRPTPTGADH